MGLFDGKKNSIPAWASYFTDKEYSAFIAAVDTYFHKTLNLTYEIIDGVVELIDNDFGLGHLGLDNLARICKQNKIEDYPEIISSHFSSMIESAKFQKEFEKIEKDFVQVQKYIAVRLYDADYMAYVGKENFLSREFAGELFAVLVFDLPYSVSNIKPEQTVPWGKTVEELFEIGLDNVRKYYKTNVEAVEFGPEKDIIFVCESEHLFVTNVLFELEAHAEFVGKGGSLVAAPNRNMALIYPINDLKVVSTINTMCAAVPEMYSNPGSLTKQIYWYRNGRFMPLPYDTKNNKINFYPPEEFVELLNSLA